MLEEEYRHRDDYFIFRTIIRRRINELARERERERALIVSRARFNIKETRNVKR